MLLPVTRYLKKKKKKKALIESGVIDLVDNDLIKALEEIIFTDFSPLLRACEWNFFLEVMPANQNTFIAAHYINQAPRQFSDWKS